MREITIKDRKFQNKLDTVLVENPTLQSVTILVLVGVGSRYESVERAGLAHFLEHVFFKGTAKRPSSKHIGMEIELLGGTTNAFTNYDYTGYYIKVPSHNFEKAVEILSDMINNSLFDEKEIEKERGVIIEEIRMYEDIPRAKVDDVFMTDVFGKHPLGREITGSVESVSSFRRKDFVEFVEENYNGSNMLVSIGGDINSESAFEIVKQHFSGLPEGKKATFAKTAPHKLGGKIHFKDRKLEQSHIIFGGFGHPRASEHRYGYKVGNALLGYGFGSRLFLVIREKLGLAYYVGSDIPVFSEVGLFKVDMGVQNGKVGLAVNATLQELAALKKGKFSDMELERAKNILIGSMTTHLEGSDDLASWYGQHKLLRNELANAEETIAKIRKVTRMMCLRPGKVF